MEACLVEAGFFVPLFDLNRCYRKQLRETGIPHILILGKPVIPRRGVYQDDEQKWQRDENQLNRIADEYLTKALAEREIERSHLESENKQARIYYLSG